MRQALVYHEEALVLAQKLGLPLLLVDLWRNIGVESSYLGDGEAGIARLQQSLASSEALGEPHLLLQALYSLALAEHARGQVAAAAGHAQRLLDASRQGKARGHQAKARYALGLCAEAAGDNTMAEQRWQQALFLAHETGQQALLWQIHAGLARIAASPALANTHNRIAAEVIDQIVYPLEDEDLCQTFRQAAPVQAVLKQLN
jgi:tetratricopeptide (TPR) repeat protein